MQVSANWGSSSDAFNSVTREVFNPQQVKQFDPSLQESVWLYRYRQTQKGWTFCIGTKGEPHSGMYSLGGFRIVPEARAALPGFSPEKEAMGLACGMEEKVFWSRLIRVAGPLGLKALDKVVGGKCVLLPTANARVGQTNDVELLNFGIACMQDFERTTGIWLTTGQDLGHGILSDGVTSSLEYLNKNFQGSILSDTSLPTAEGNFYTLKGMLQAFGVSLKDAKIGIYGCGNIGVHLLDRLEQEIGARTRDNVYVIESAEYRRKQVADRVKAVYAPDDKAEFLKLGLDALVLNANGGSLDSESIKVISANPTIKVICGCENLVMPNPQDGEVLRKAKKLYSPTELCGMMGYLTAVEEYLSKQQKVTFDIKSLLEAAKLLEPASEKAGKLAIQKDFSISFEDAIKELFTKR